MSLEIIEIRKCFNIKQYSNYQYATIMVIDWNDGNRINIRFLTYKYNSTIKSKLDIEIEMERDRERGREGGREMM